LMDKAVNHEFQNPIFYKRDLIFTKLAVDKWVNYSKFTFSWQVKFIICVFFPFLFLFFYLYDGNEKICWNQRINDPFINCLPYCI
jgi:hypothetical protein